MFISCFQRGEDSSQKRLGCRLEKARCPGGGGGLQGPGLWIHPLMILLRFQRGTYTAHSLANHSPQYFMGSTISLNY